MSEPRQFITSDALGKEVCKALGIDFATVSRIVIDIKAGEAPLYVYVELVGDTRLLQIGWDTLTVEKLEVKFSDSQKPS